MNILTITKIKDLGGEKINDIKYFIFVYPVFYSKNYLSLKKGIYLKIVTVSLLMIKEVIDPQSEFP